MPIPDSPRAVSTLEGLLDVARYRPLSRREALALSGALALALTGCGGTDNSASVVPASLVTAPRSVPTGDLANQIQQYSTVVANMSQTWVGQSPAIDTAMSFIQQNRAAGRAIPGLDLSLQAAQVGLPALLEVYEQLANTVGIVDDAGALGDKITASNNLVSTSSVSSPQWTAALLDHNYQALRIIGGTIKLMQTHFITHLVGAVTAQTDPVAKQVAYFILGDTYNGWVDAVSAYMGVPSDPALKLDISSSITVDSIPAQLARLPALLDLVPLGPGNRTLTRAPGSSFLDNLRSFATTSLLGTVAQFYLISNTTTSILGPDLVKLDAHLQANTGTFIKNLIGGNGPGLNTIRSLAVNVLAQLAINLGSPEAACLVEILAGAFNTGAYAAAALGSSVTVLGVVVFALAAALSVAQLKQNLKDCEPILVAAAASLPSVGKQVSNTIADALDGLTNFCENPPPPSVPLTVSPDVRKIEYDQIWKNKLVKRVITPKNPTFLKMPPDAARNILCGALSPSRAVVGTTVRTFTNVESAVLALILDLGTRNPTTVDAIATPTALTFFRSATAFILVRPPGQSTVSVPAITDADLLCTGPGLVPVRSAAPEDLSAPNATLPALQTAGSLAPGVNVNVH